MPNKTGLTQKQAEKLLSTHGPNSFERKKTINPWLIFLQQFQSPLVLILVFAAAILGIVEFFTHSEGYIDIVLILLIVLFSAISGFLQEYKAEKSIEELKKMSSPKARVVRDGLEVEIDATNIVPGDLVIIEAGSIIPADCEMSEGYAVKVNEAILTGESASVGKAVGDILYMNTYCIVGECTAIVKETGRDTKVGEIAEGLEQIEEEQTPFKKEVDQLGRRLFWIIIIIALFTALIGAWKFSITTALLTAVALSVAAIPEGLPAVLVLSLAVGARAMVKQKALVRKLGIVESMGGVNIICTDKTGTLTKNKMEVVKGTLGTTIFDAIRLPKQHSKDFLLCSALNNNVREVLDGKKVKKIGDETEIALLQFAEKYKYKKSALLQEYNIIGEIPFDAERKMMTTLVEKKQKQLTSYTKGAPEVILKHCTHIMIGGKKVALSKKHKTNISNTIETFGGEALRVLALAYKEVSYAPKENNMQQLESGMIWLGMQAMIDPARKEVKNAVKVCHTAGIRIIMVTGDNPITATAIANNVGILSTHTYTGQEVEQMTDTKLKLELKNGVNIFARLNPTHKLRIMTLLQSEGNRVAMTGDGVNDALALKKADVGIAMGIRGTDVSKQASDLILLDDNFATIVTAIKEGRRIFNNIQKFVNYLLTSNFAEVGVIFIATILFTFGEPIMLPIHLLWINLLTDGLPALALGVDPSHPGIMKEHPRKHTEQVLSKRVFTMVTAIGIHKILTLFAIFFTLYFSFGFAIARTALFTGFIFYEVIIIANIRLQEHLTWLSNKKLLGALLLTFLLQVIIVHTPLNAFFGLVPLGIVPWITVLGFVLFGFFTVTFLTSRFFKLPS